MIDPLTEKVISLADAAKGLPTRRAGKHAHISCVYRWTVSGCKGIKLESIQIGGTRCTSREALSRFFDRLGKATGPNQDQAVVRTPAQRQRAIVQAERELRAAGF